MTAASTAPPRKLLGRLATSMIDQAWLSALNLALGLVLIRLASKDTYGAYAQLYVGALFVVSMSESLILNPLNTQLPRADAARRALIVGTAVHFQRRLAALMAALFGVAALVIAHMTELPAAIPTGAAFAAYIYFNSLRELQRGLQFIENRPDLVLRSDFVYGLVLAAGIAAAASFDLSLPTILAALSVACVAALGAAGRIAWTLPDRDTYRAILADIWQRGKLGMAGALSSWVVNYSYLYFVALWLGASATAELNASRLLLMPVLLSVVAWQRVALPAFSRLYAADNHHAANRLAAVSLAGIEVAALVYIGVLWLVLPWLARTVLGPTYQGIEPLVLSWAVYFAMSALRSVSSTILISTDSYRVLLVAAVGGLVVMLGTIVIAIPHFGTVGAIGTLTLVELLSALFLWGFHFYQRGLH